MKHMIALSFLAAVLLTGTVSAANAEAPAKTVKAVLCEPGVPVEGGFDNRFVPYHKDSKDTMPETSFRVDYNEFFWALDIRLKEPDKSVDNVLEIFFVPEGAPSYYQLYGSVRDRTLAFYPHGTFRDRTHPYPQEDFGISYHETPDGYQVRVMVPWSNFLYQFENPEWKFNLVRARGAARFTWQGELHKPEQWGKISFAGLDQETQANRYRQLIRRLNEQAANRTGYFRFDPDRYNNRSHQIWCDTLAREFSQYAKQIANLENVAENVDISVYKNMFEKMRSRLERRRFVATLPFYRLTGTGDWNYYSAVRNDDGSWTKTPLDNVQWNEIWQFSTAAGSKWNTPYRIAEHVITQEMEPDAELYLTNFAAPASDPEIVWIALHNDKQVATGKIKDLPLNIKIGKVKKGDRVGAAMVHPGKNGRPHLRFTLEVCRNGIQPGPAFQTDRPRATEAAPKRLPDGSVPGTYLHRTLGHLYAIRKACTSGKMPRVYFVGDSITDGLHGKAWDTIAKYRPFNLGISGDWTQNVLWRLQSGPFGQPGPLDECKPELLVLMIGTNNGTYSIQEVADGIKAILELTRRKSPETKILLLGIFPRGKFHAVDCRIEKINAIIKTYADNRMIFYKDLAYLFIDENRNVRRDLLPDGLHPGRVGNQVWMDAMLPLLDQLLPEK